MRPAVLVLLAACASSSREAVPASPPAIPEARVVETPAVNPVGAFTYATATPEGTPVSGVITITGSPGSYAGSVEAGGLGTFPIRSVTVSGQTVSVIAVHPEGEIDMRLTFVGDDFTGSWRLGLQGGEIAGKRRP